MKKVIWFFIALIVMSSMVDAKPVGRALIDKATGQVLSWGYTDFKETNGTKIIENIVLGQGENINDGLRWDGEKIVKDPAFAKKIKTEKERLMEVIGITDDDLKKVKDLSTVKTSDVPLGAPLKSDNTIPVAAGSGAGATALIGGAIALVRKYMKKKSDDKIK